MGSLDANARLSVHVLFISVANLSMDNPLYTLHAAIILQTIPLSHRFSTLDGLSRWVIFWSSTPSTF